MAVGATEFLDAAAWGPGRSTMRDAGASDAASARAGFSRALDTAFRAADTAKDAALTRNVAERARSTDAVAAARADRIRAADAAAIDDGASKAAVYKHEASEKAAQAPRAAGASSSDAASPRSDSVAAARGVGPTRTAPATTADKASPPAPKGEGAAPTGTDDKAPTAKASATESGDGKSGEIKGGDATPATPTVALVLGAGISALAGEAASPPNAGSGAASAATGALGTEAEATGVAATGAGATAIGSGRGDVPVQAAAAGDAAPATAATVGDAGAAAKTDFLRALADSAQAAPTAPDPIVKASAGLSAGASLGAEKGAAAAATPPVPLGQVPMTIGLRSLAGSSEFQIRLDPLELGRVDVTLDIDKDKGTVTTHLVVERVETLAMLQRDAGSLQQALTQAGLDPSQGGITLSLRSDGGSGGETARREEQSSRGSARPGTTSSEAAGTEVAPSRALRGLSGIDIRI